MKDILEQIQENVTVLNIDYTPKPIANKLIFSFIKGLKRFPFKMNRKLSLKYIRLRLN